MLPLRPIYSVLLLLVVTQPIFAQSTSEWRADLEYLHQKVVNDYPNLFHNVSQAEWEAAVQQLNERIPSLQRHEIIVEMARLVAMFRIGHTAMRLGIWHSGGDSPTGFHHLPLMTYTFDDGVYIRSAHRDHSDLVGAKLLAVGELPVDKALEAIRPIVPHENEMGFLSSAPFFLACPEVLHATGVIEQLDEVALTVLKEGKEWKVVIKPVKGMGFPGNYGYCSKDSDWVDANHSASEPMPLWLTDLDRKRYFKYLPEAKTVYVRHSTVRHEDDETIPQFFERVYDFIEKENVEKFVLDVRLNGGGNNYLNKEVITGAIRSKVNERGRFFIITGRRTFSACQNLINELEKYTEAIFVGEPSSENVNFYGDNRRESLPNSGLDVFLSYLWWQNHDPRDTRSWKAPDIAVDLSFDDYRRNHDPMLAAVLNWKPTPSLTENVKVLVQKGSADKAYEIAQQYISDPQRRYVASDMENKLNNLGYDFMGRNEVTKASEVFRINMKLFPESANTYDSYGESLWKLGKTEEAERYYKKALQMDPDGVVGENAKAMLERIRR